MEKQKKTKKRKNDRLKEGSATEVVQFDSKTTGKKKDKKHHSSDAKENTSKSIVIVQSQKQDENTNLPNKKHKKKKHKILKEENEEPDNYQASLTQSSGNSVSEQTNSDDLSTNSKILEKAESFYSQNKKKKKKKQYRDIENEEAVSKDLSGYAIESSDDGLGIQMQKSKRNLTNATQEEKQLSQSMKGKNKNKKRNQDLYNEEFTEESEDRSGISTQRSKEIGTNSDTEYNFHLTNKKKKYDKGLHDEDVTSNPDEGATIPTQRSKQVSVNSDNEYNAHLPHRKKNKRKNDKEFHKDTEDATSNPDKKAAISTHWLRQVNENSLLHRKKKKRKRELHNEDVTEDATSNPDEGATNPTQRSIQVNAISDNEYNTHLPHRKKKKRKRDKELHNEDVTEDATNNPDEEATIPTQRSMQVSAISDIECNAHPQRKKKKRKYDKELHDEDVAEDAASNPHEGATIPTRRSRQVNANSDNDYNSHIPHRKKKKRKCDDFYNEEVNENATNQPKEGSAIHTQRQVTVNSENAHLLQQRKKKKRNRHLHKNMDFIIQSENNPAIMLDMFLEGDYEEFPSVQLRDFGMGVISKDNVEKLRLKGMQIQNGRWTKLEDKILRENMLKFCEEVNISESEKLVFPRLYEQETEALVEIINENQMFYKIGCGIDRPLRNIYYRCRKLFDTNNYKGEFTKEEVKTIVRLQKKYGNKWTKIGRLIDRNADSVTSSVRFGRANRTVGAWTKEERRQLIAAVKEFVEGEAGSEAWYYNIPWERVSKKVPTRECRQCRGQWLAILSGLAAGTTTPEVDNWNKADNVKLIERIIEMNIHDEGEIDWLALMPEFEKAVSPQKLRFRWHIIKSNYVPRHNYKTLDEILDYVAEEVLPSLKARLNRSKGRKRKKKQKHKKLEPTSVEFVEDDSELESD